jgi:hypothetical protein
MKTYRGVELHGSELTASRPDRCNLFQGEETGVFIALEEGWTPEAVSVL